MWQSISVLGEKIMLFTLRVKNMSEERGLFGRDQKGAEHCSEY